MLLKASKFLPSYIKVFLYYAYIKRGKDIIKIKWISFRGEVCLPKQIVFAYTLVVLHLGYFMKFKKVFGDGKGFWVTEHFAQTGSEKRVQRVMFLT